MNILKDTVFKEASNLGETMRWKFFDVIEVHVLGIIGTYCNNLIILLSLYQMESDYFGKCNCLEINIFFKPCAIHWSDTIFTETY